MNDIKKGSSHIWLPYTQMQNHLPQLEVKKTSGSKIYLKNGKVLIDGIASWWSVAHGYNHPHIIKETAKQLRKLPHVMLAGLANDQTYKLAVRLAKFVGLKNVFFSDSGSTAIEVAMKICWQYHINLGNKAKTKFVSFKNSYHGDTTGAMSLADLDSSIHQKFKNILIENFSVDLPKEKEDFEKFEKFIKENHQEIAGIFVEPLVQCAGGMKFHKAEILKEIFDISKKYNLIFIADECAVGFYRLGSKFAFSQADIKPDIVVLGKALTGGIMTLAATLVDEKIYKSFLSDSIETALMHGPTFMGNALACSAANASLDLFAKENYQLKVKKIEKFLIKNLEQFRNYKNVKDVRVLGALGVIETDLEFKDMLFLRKEFVKHGVFLRPFAGVIYIMPALTIKESELKKIVDAITVVMLSLSKHDSHTSTGSV